MIRALILLHLISIDQWYLRKEILKLIRVSLISRENIILNVKQQLKAQKVQLFPDKEEKNLTSLTRLSKLMS